VGKGALCCEPYSLVVTRTERSSGGQLISNAAVCSWHPRWVKVCPSELRSQHVGCTPNSCGSIASPISAALGQELPLLLAQFALQYETTDTFCAGADGCS
jgi:hypothetical protein